MDWSRKEFSTIKQVLTENQKGMTVTDISKSIQMNRHSVAKYLEVLVAAGHVDMRAFGKSKIFYLSQRVPISAMLSFSSDLIITLDRDLRARYVNDKFLEFMGLGREEVLNKNILNFSYLLESEPPMIPYVQAALGGIESSVDVFYHQGVNGYFFIIKAMPTVFEDGENGVTMILSDITERVNSQEVLLKERGELEIRVKERTAELEKANLKLKGEINKRKSSENLLRESEKKYRTLVENVNDMIWEMDEKAVYTYCSPKSYDMFGYLPDEMVGLRPFDLMTPENEEKLYNIMTSTPLDSKHTIVITAEHLHKDGHPVLIEVRSQPMFDDTGTLTGFMGVARDVTDRKVSSGTLQQNAAVLNILATRFPDIIFRISGDGTILDHNSACSKQFFTNSDSFLGKNLTNVLPEEAGLKTSEAIRYVHSTGGLAVIEYLLPAAGRDELFEARFQPVTGEQIVVIMKLKEATKSE